MEKEKKKSNSTVEKSDKLYLVQAIKVNISTMIDPRGNVYAVVPGLE